MLEGADICRFPVSFCRFQEVGIYGSERRIKTLDFKQRFCLIKGRAEHRECTAAFS